MDSSPKDDKALSGIEITPDNIDELVKKHSALSLDIACGQHKQPGFFGIDIRDWPGVDLVWDVNIHPWPLPDECATRAFSSHLIEHIPPVAITEKGTRFPFIEFMDEVWRLLKPDGQFALSYPHGSSQGFLQDPTHCLIDGAEVLTSSGFKRIQDVEIGESILTLNQNYDGVEYSPCIGTIIQDYDGDILHFKNSRMDIAVTPNHDLIWNTWHTPPKKYYKNRADTFEFLAGFARRGIANIPGWIGNNPRCIRIENVRDGEPFEFDSGDFMELLGWILSEGGFHKKGNCCYVSIHQSRTNNSDKYTRIENLLRKMGLNFHSYNNVINVTSRNLYYHLCNQGNSLNRFIPSEYKNYSIDLLIRLLESLILGDGSPHPSGGGNEYTTISPILASDINEIALKCGFRSHINIRPPKKFLSPGGKIYTRKEQYRLSMTYDCPMLYPKPKREHYSGKIVCIQVEKNHNFLARYNGQTAWVGNCNPKNESTWAYFDPLEPNTNGFLYKFYRPKPWKINHLTWSPAANVEVILEKRREDHSYYE